MEAIAYKRFQDKAKISTNEGLLAATKRFYEDESQKDLYDKVLIKSFNSDKLLEICLELAKEAINMDFISFISTGIRGNLLNEMNKCLINL